MSVINLLLNLAALLLWLNYRASGVKVITRSRGPNLLSTLTRVNIDQPQSWMSLLGLVLLLFLRSFFYRQIGSALDWTPVINLGVISIPFRSDLFSRMFLYSLLSFVIFAAIFHMGLLLLSILNHKLPETDFFQRLVKVQLGVFDKLPRLAKVILPFALAGLLWMIVSPLLVYLEILPGPKPGTYWTQTGIIAAEAWLAWKWPIVLLLLIYVLNSYVYLGAGPIWNYIAVTGRHLLRPLSWLPLRYGRFDAAPFIALGLVFGAFEGWTRMLALLHQRLL